MSDERNVKMSDLACYGSNWHPDKAPSHDSVRAAVEIIREHMEAEWISEGCKADHAFGCASCQAVLLMRELDGLISWLDDQPTPITEGEK